MGARAGLILCLAVVAITLFRLFALTQSATNLAVDEAQYWSWAQTPSWGYYSKPPMVAWLIGLAQMVCGSGEACVRAPSALAWAVTAIGIAAAAWTLYGREVGLWAGLAALLAPGAAFSARLISTDAPLLAFWSLALLAFVQLRAGRSARWGILLAVALGLGLLSKYAMLYFLGGAVVAVLVDPASRSAFRRTPVWGGLLAGLTFLVPNLAWQARHGLATLRHTADNATGGGATPGVADGLEFVAAQFMLAGPVVFAFACAAAWAMARGRLVRPEDRMLVAFAAPILVVLTVVAFITRAHGNWGATALIAVFILGSAFAVRQGRQGWLAGGLAFGLLTQTALPLLDANALRLSFRGEAVFDRVLGWDVFGETVKRRAADARAVLVVAETRRDAAALLYYGRDQSVPVAVWPADGPPQDHFQMDRPLTAAGAARGLVLAVSSCAPPGGFSDWRRVVDLGEVRVETGPGATRRWRLYLLVGPPAVIRRPPPCPSG